MIRRWRTNNFVMLWLSFIFGKRVLTSNNDQYKLIKRVINSDCSPSDTSGNDYFSILEHTYFR